MIFVNKDWVGYNLTRSCLHLYLTTILQDLSIIYLLLAASVTGLLARVFRLCGLTQGSPPCAFSLSPVGVIPLIPKLISSPRVLGKWSCRELYFVWKNWPSACEFSRVAPVNSVSVSGTIGRVFRTIGRVPRTIRRVHGCSTECLGVRLTLRILKSLYPELTSLQWVMALRWPVPMMRPRSSADSS
jgi:hypothetical protein